MAVAWSYAAPGSGDTQTMPQAPSRLAEVNRMLAAETERLQDAARQMKLHGQRATSAQQPLAVAATEPLQFPQFSDASAAAAFPSCSWLEGLAAAPATEASNFEAGLQRRFPAVHNQKRPEVGLALGELSRSHQEAQDTMRRLQRELGLAEASLQQACSDGLHLHEIQARRAKREVERLFEAELQQVQCEHRAREEALEAACDQLRKSTELERSSREGADRAHQAELEQLCTQRNAHETSLQASMERLRGDLQEAERREQRSRAEAERARDVLLAEVEQLRDVVRRLQDERTTDKRAREELERSRRDLQGEVDALRTDLCELQAAEEEGRRAKEKSDRSGRTLAEEKLRLHADRGRLREAHQKAERELHAEAEALREARRLQQRTCQGEEDAERRCRASALEAYQEAAVVKRLQASLREEALTAGDFRSHADTWASLRLADDERIADRMRAEIADLLEETAMERRAWKEAERKCFQEEDMERKSREEAERKLEVVVSELHELATTAAEAAEGRPQAPEAELPRVGDGQLEALRGENARLQAALQEVLKRDAERMELERERWRTERDSLERAEHRTAAACEEAERRREEDAREVERLHSEVRRLERAQDLQQRSLQADRSRELQSKTAELLRCEDEANQLRKDVKAKSADLRSLDDEARQLRIDNKAKSSELRLRDEEIRQLRLEIEELKDALANDRRPCKLCTALEDELQTQGEAPEAELRILRSALAAERRSRDVAEKALRAALEARRGRQDSQSPRDSPGASAERAAGAALTPCLVRAGSARRSSSSGGSQRRVRLSGVEIVPASPRTAVGSPPLGVVTPRSGGERRNRHPVAAARDAASPPVGAAAPTAAASRSPGAALLDRLEDALPDVGRWEPGARASSSSSSPRPAGERWRQEAQGGRRRSQLLEEMSLLPEDLRSRLASASFDRLDALAAASSDGDDWKLSERTLMMQLYVIMAEMRDLPDAATSSFAFKRLWRYLERALESAPEPETAACGYAPRGCSGVPPG